MAQTRWGTTVVGMHPRVVCVPGHLDGRATRTPIGDAEIIDTVPICTAGSREFVVFSHGFASAHHRYKHEDEPCKDRKVRKPNSQEELKERKDNHKNKENATYGRK